MCLFHQSHPRHSIIITMDKQDVQDNIWRRQWTNQVFFLVLDTVKVLHEICM